MGKKSKDKKEPPASPVKKEPAATAAAAAATDSPADAPLESATQWRATAQASTADVAMREAASAAFRRDVSAAMKIKKRFN